MDLQTAFYIVGIVFMSLMLIIIIGIAVTVLIIKAKINAIHRRIEEKLSVITNIANIGADVVNKAKRAVTQH